MEAGPFRIIGDGFAVSYKRWINPRWRNWYSETCSSIRVYTTSPVSILLLDVLPAANVLFASELLGAVRGIDPDTGHNFDDTRRYIDASSQASDAEKQMIFSENAKRVYSRLVT